MSSRKVEAGQASPAIPTIRPKFVFSGPDPLGLRLSSRTINRSEHVLQTGEKQIYESVSSAEVIQIEHMSLDPAMFEVPAGYKNISGQGRAVGPRRK